MNIQISDHWLKEFIETRATPHKIKEYLSLCGQSVERLTNIDGDYLYDIEITTNRPDCLSVYGIARELAAILPRFDIKAELKDVPVLKIKNNFSGLPLSIKITKASLCPRFTALVFDEVKIKPSPKFVQERLSMAGIRSLNNVIDISNYLMLELGQPMHTFDYDKILKNKMILRESKEGESVITLDGQERKLPIGSIVIEDGEGRVVDLCGIMGAKNSETDENTKRVLLFIQTYDPVKIRKTCQELAFRTEASSRFEKGVDPEGVILAMERANLLFKEWCGAKQASELFDIYPNPPLKKEVSVSEEKIETLVGIKIPLPEAKKILDNLGYITKISSDKKTITAKVPHFRSDDINIPEDLVEEIARIYGYHNLPNILPPLPERLEVSPDLSFDYEYKIKTALKFWGFTETMSYSMISEQLLQKTKEDPKKLLKIANPLSEDMVFMRNSLIPSLLEIIKNNNDDEAKIFEIANVYINRGSEELPDEYQRLTVVTTENNFLKIKGILEAILAELNITNIEIILDDKIENLFLEKNYSVYVGNSNIGFLGQVRGETLRNMEIKKPLWILDLELRKVFALASANKKYSPLPKYPPIIEDLSIEFPPKTFVGPILETIKKTDLLIKKVDLIDSFKETRTFRITFQSESDNLSSLEVKKSREKIIREVGEKFLGKLKE